MSITLRVAAVLVFVVACSKKSEKKDEKTDKPAGEMAGTAKAKPPADPPAQPESKGGCSYITEAEASEVLKQPSKYRSNDGSDNCIIDPVGEETATTTSVDFTVNKGETGGFDYLAKDGEPLAGVGDKAVWSGPEMITQVAIVKGADELTMTLTGDAGKDPAVIKAFAEKVFSHL